MRSAANIFFVSYQEKEGNEVVSQLSFTNALILKIHQLSKQVRRPHLKFSFFVLIYVVFLQGLLNKLMIFSFACHISNFDIAEEDRKRCLRSFFMFARQLSSIREGIKDSEQKEEFDLEVQCKTYDMLFV